jgi:hypothetical protein
LGKGDANRLKPFIATLLARAVAFGLPYVVFDIVGLGEWHKGRQDF